MPESVMTDSSQGEQRPMTELSRRGLAEGITRKWEQQRLIVKRQARPRNSTSPHPSCAGLHNVTDSCLSWEDCRHLPKIETKTPSATAIPQPSYKSLPNIKP